MVENENDKELLEKGDIFFFYRPKVEEEEPQSRADVQQLYMILVPEKRERFRVAIIGKEKLPDPAKSGHRKFWGFVDIVRKDPNSIKKELGPKEYSTKTRGQRHQPGARPAGEGVYEILVHKDHTHLVYVLELPESEGEVQKELGIESQASYIISIKNPERGSPQSAGLSEDRQAKYSKSLQEVFRGRKFANADPPEFLDKEGCEFVLIAASADIKEELDLTVDTDDESMWESDTAKRLKISKSRPLEPLTQGKWE